MLGLIVDSKCHNMLVIQFVTTGNSHYNLEPSTRAKPSIFNFHTFNSYKNIISEYFRAFAVKNISCAIVKYKYNGRTLIRAREYFYSG